MAHFRAQYDAGTLRYSELKPAVADALVAELNPIRERRAELAAAPQRVWEALEQGAERARAVARPTLAEARERMGFRRPQAIRSMRPGPYGRLQKCEVGLRRPLARQAR